MRSGPTAKLLAVLILVRTLWCYKFFHGYEAGNYLPWHYYTLAVISIPVAWIFALIGSIEVLLNKFHGVMVLIVSVILMLFGALTFGTVYSFIPYLSELFPATRHTTVFVACINAVVVYFLQKAVADET